MNALPVPATLAELIRDAARRFGDAEAIVGVDGRLNYARIDRESDRIASALGAAGIKKGDHVGICAGNTGQWVTLFYGIAKAGAVCVPINTRLKPAEIRYQLAQARVRLLFLADRLLSIDFLTVFQDVAHGMTSGYPQSDLPHLQDVVLLGERNHPHCRGLADFLGQGTGAPVPASPGPGDVALIQYTSGTTSQPKGAMLTHGSMVRNAAAVASRMGLEVGHRYLSARPFFHVAGTTLSIAASAVVGATLVTMLRFTAEDAVILMDTERCTHFSGNDTMFLMLLEREDAHSKSRLIGGWAAASPAVIERAVSELGARNMVVAYGLSEASPNVAISDCQDPLPDRIAGWMRPHEGLEVCIADPENGLPLPAGQSGEIRVRGWTVMQGYFDKPRETAATLGEDGFLRTGDMGVMAEDGRIRFLGRLKEIIRVGGENVSPGEIEDVLLNHPDIAQAQVVGMPDPRLIEIPVAYVIPRNGVALDPGQILAWAKTQLAGFKLPRHIAVIDSFEPLGLTASGKVQKARLRLDAAQRFC
ncbi:AMP-binding protein [Pelagibacterium sediminicola]|uniref:AMP-binding protein n=1 Tax=Pelagibacterium sediminicola TaxID=2248761 RepID=UPI000E31716A|nr:AMP-binding protein [Pelagibacterium sediminicola]